MSTICRGAGVLAARPDGSVGLRAGRQRVSLILSWRSPHARSFSRCPSAVSNMGTTSFGPADPHGSGSCSSWARAAARLPRSTLRSFIAHTDESYAISPDELKKLQFYISGQVVAHRIDVGSPTDTPGVVMVADHTPGLVQESGSDWLRVAFTQGGEGLLFRLRADRGDSVYALATTTESGQIVLVSQLPEPVLITGGRRFRSSTAPRPTCSSTLTT